MCSLTAAIVFIFKIMHVTFKVKFDFFKDKMFSTISWFIGKKTANLYNS